MPLYLIHCGFYDPELSDGLYESHTNFYLVADNADEARAKAKTNPTFRDRKMHIDGLQEIVTVDGFDIQLVPSIERPGETLVRNVKHRDLAPKNPA